MLGWTRSSPAAGAAQKSGFGSKVIDASVKRQLGGEISCDLVEWRPGNARFGSSRIFLRGESGPAAKALSAVPMSRKRGLDRYSGHSRRSIAQPAAFSRGG